MAHWYCGCFGSREAANFGAIVARVYHSSAAGRSHFDGADMAPKINGAVLRQLAGVPVVANVTMQGGETRKTGSAALKCALVTASLAAGLADAAQQCLMTIFHC